MLLKPFLKGIQDSIRVDKVFKLIIKSKLIRSRLTSSILANGVLFLGSLIIYSLLIAPIANWLRVSSIIEFLFAVLFHLLWVYPLHLMTMILNTFWVQDIYDQGFQLLKVKLSQTRPKNKFQTTISNQIMRGLILMLYWLQIVLINAILPWPLNWIVKTVYLAWYYSFQCFQYRCYAENKTIWESASWAQRNWLYFLGFGTLMAIVISCFSGMWGSGVFMLIFPFFVLASINTSLPVIRLNQFGGQNSKYNKLPIFQPSLTMNHYLLRLIKSKFLDDMLNQKNRVSQSLKRKTDEKQKQGADQKDTQQNYQNQICKDFELTKSLYRSSVMHEEDFKIEKPKIYKEEEIINSSLSLKKQKSIQDEQSKWVVVDGDNLQQATIINKNMEQQ